MHCADNRGSIEAGAAVRFGLANNKASISVIVPGTDGLVQRTCRRTRRWDLLSWFRKVEALAWEIVTAHYGRRRPKNDLPSYRPDINIRILDFSSRTSLHGMRGLNRRGR